ncbi:MAG: hypothetical protein ACWGO2_09570, partial [Syntrophobacteria bacterium]|jgi:hypothetical protein
MERWSVGALLVLNVYPFPILHYSSTPILQIIKTPPSYYGERGFLPTKGLLLVLRVYLYLSKTSAGLVVLPVALGKSVAT